MVKRHNWHQTCVVLKYGNEIYLVIIELQNLIQYNNLETCSSWLFSASVIYAPSDMSKLRNYLTTLSAETTHALFPPTTNAAFSSMPKQGCSGLSIIIWSESWHLRTPLLWEALWWGTQSACKYPYPPTCMYAQFILCSSVRCGSTLINVVGSMESEYLSSNQQMAPVLPPQSTTSCSAAVRIMASRPSAFHQWIA